MLRVAVSLSSFYLFFSFFVFEPTEASAEQRKLKKDDDDAVADGENVRFNTCLLNGRERGDEQA